MEKLKIEVIEKDGQKCLLFNSIIDEDAELGIIDGKIEIERLFNVEIIELLLNYRIEEVSPYLRFIQFNKKIKYWDFDSTVGMLLEANETWNPHVNIVFSLESENWNKPYTILEFVNSISSVTTQNNRFDYDLDSGFWWLTFSMFFSSDNIIRNEINKAINILEDILNQTHTTLLANVDKDIIFSYFTFPEEIKAACKQYLVYFAQFLMDLGIEAYTEIKEEAQQTLFKVIPKNKEESLDKIREALDVYLNIPKDFDIQVAQNNDVAVMQWQANIKFLESQIILAQSAIQYKDATIQKQQETIELLQLSKFQNKDILTQKETEESKTEEEIAGGLVKVKEFDVFGLISINFPKIIRDLKRKFKR